MGLGWIREKSSWILWHFRLLSLWQKAFTSEATLALQVLGRCTGAPVRAKDIVVAAWLRHVFGFAIILCHLFRNLESIRS